MLFSDVYDSIAFKLAHLMPCVVTRLQSRLSVQSEDVVEILISGMAHSVRALGGLDASSAGIGIVSGSDASRILDSLYMVNAIDATTGGAGADAVVAARAAALSLGMTVPQGSTDADGLGGTTAATAADSADTAPVGSVAQALGLQTDALGNPAPESLGQGPCGDAPEGDCRRCVEYWQCSTCAASHGRGGQWRGSQRRQQVIPASGNG